MKLNGPLASDNNNAPCRILCTYINNKLCTMFRCLLFLRVSIRASSEPHTQTYGMNITYTYGRSISPRILKPVETLVFILRTSMATILCYERRAYYNNSQHSRFGAKYQLPYVLTSLLVHKNDSSPYSLQYCQHR